MSLKNTNPQYLANELENHLITLFLLFNNFENDLVNI